MASPNLQQYASIITSQSPAFAAPNTVELLEGDLLGSLYRQGVMAETAETKHWYVAVAETLRDHLLPLLEKSQRKWNEPNGKRAHLLSIEWLLGPLSGTAKNSLGMTETLPAAIQNLLPEGTKITLPDIFGYEPDPGLGNGGLGRLMACFLDSAASRHDPVMGYGLFYKKGFFRQDVHSGFQRELSDEWLIDDKNPWSISRPDIRYEIPMFGEYDASTKQWKNALKVPVIAEDIIFPSFDGQGANTLRLWKVDPKFDISRIERELFGSVGVNDQLYPRDKEREGKNLRFVQGYILATTSVRDILRTHFERHHKTVDQLPESIAIQLNDTHPSFAIPELLRYLTDEKGLEWNKAVDITRQCCFYTNHTVLPESLEKWHVGLVSWVAPHHFNIIERLQSDLMLEVQQKGSEAGLPQQDIWDMMARVSIIHDNHVRTMNMSAYETAMTNGVAEMHSGIIFKDKNLLPDFAFLRGEQAKANRTNGITPRSWLVQANPSLSELATEVTGGKEWVGNLAMLDAALKPYQNDAAFLERIADIKHNNKVELSNLIHKHNGTLVDPEAMFDIHVKRIHEYKRQFMNTLHTVALYLDIIENPNAERPNVVKVFAGKAAPDYDEAKKEIRLIKHLETIINNDPRIGDKLKVTFLEDYRVSLAKVIIPAADLSEQISTAGKEASGTSNMKFALNGAVTIGTLDGANVEIRQKVGSENFLLFGHTKPQLDQLIADNYDPMTFIERDSRLKAALEFVRTTDNGRFASLVNEIIHGQERHGKWVKDEWKTVADVVGQTKQAVTGYFDMQDTAHKLFQQPKVWGPMAVANIRGGAHFSSDATMERYVVETWNIGEKGAAYAAAIRAERQQSAIAQQTLVA